MEGGSKRGGKTLRSNLDLWPHLTSHHTGTHLQGFVISRLRGGWELFPFPRDALTCYLGPDVTWIGDTLATVCGEGSASNKRKLDEVQALLSYLAKKRFQGALWS